MTAVAGRRMAETLARRGGAHRAAAGRRAGGGGRDRRVDQVAAPGVGHPAGAHAGDAVADALNLLPKRAHGAVVVVDEGGRPVGTVDEAACTGVDRFTRLGDVLDAGPAHAAAGHARRARCSRRSAPAASRSALDADGRLAGLLTALGALRAELYRPTLDGAGRLRTAAAVGINGDVGGQGEGAARRGRGRARGRHRARPPGEDARRAACGPEGRLRRRVRPCRWWQATSSPRRACATSPRPAPTSSRSGSGRARCAPRG